MLLLGHRQKYPSVVSLPRCHFKGECTLVPDELFTPTKTSVATFDSPSNADFEESRVMESRHVLLIDLHSEKVSGCVTFKRKGCAGCLSRQWSQQKQCCA